MVLDRKVYEAYLEILQRELVPAMGCTEPAAIAFGAAKAKQVLGAEPASIVVEASRNIIKNIKSVAIPNTGGMRGIETAVAAGIVGGTAELGLDVLSGLSTKHRKEIKEFVENHEIIIRQDSSNTPFCFTITMSSLDDTVKLHINNHHTHIEYIEKNGVAIYKAATIDSDASNRDVPAYEMLNVADIVTFAYTVQLEDIREYIAKQILLNSAIAKEGLAHKYGANIGKVLYESYSDIYSQAKAMAAAASDARMGGCELPVIIVAGSGNQGITASVPIIEYAKALGSSEDRLMRAITLSDLLTIHQKRFVGTLSAYCGVVCAGAASGAGIAFLHGAGYDDIAHTLVNALAISSGIICDGAKPSCAGKIALAVEAGIIGFSMCRNGQEFLAGEGIVDKGVENTIRNVGIIGNAGMRETDMLLIQLMLGSEKEKYSPVGKPV